MKNSIIYLGIAIVTFTTEINASNNHVNALIFKNPNGSALNGNPPENNTYGFETNTKGKLDAPAEEAIFQPENSEFTNRNRIEEIIAEDNKIIESSISNNSELLFLEKPIEEIIIEDNKIIESTINNEVRPIYLEKSIEDSIEEDNRIIESDISIERQPLDFNKINSNLKSIQPIKIKKFVGM